MAERKQRPNAGDRRLISERTAKSLRMQAAPLHIYRGGHGSIRDRARRYIPLPHSRPYTSIHDRLSESEGEEEYGSMLGRGEPLEGAQINTDLYDAYFSSSSSSYVPRSPDRARDSAQSPEPTLTGSWVLNPPTESTPQLSSLWPGLS